MVMDANALDGGEVSRLIDKLRAAEAQVAALTQERDELRVSRRWLPPLESNDRTRAEAAEAALATTRQALERIQDESSDAIAKAYARRALAATEEQA